KDSKRSWRSPASVIAPRCRARRCSCSSASRMTSISRSLKASRSRRQSRPRSWSPASTSRRSGTSPPKSADSVRPSHTKARASSTPTSTSSARKGRRSRGRAMSRLTDRTARRTASVRRKVKLAAGTSGRARLSVFRSSKHIYAQLIDDVKGATLAAASSLEKPMREGAKTGANIAAAKAVGKLIAERAKEKGIKDVVFDRGGYLYHGRIKALADAAREGGLNF